jgi:hypothetical protein
VADLSSISSIDSGSQYDAQQYAVNAYGVQASQDYLITLANSALTATFPVEMGDLACPVTLDLPFVNNCIYVNATDDFAAYRPNVVNAEELQNTGTILYNKSDFSVHSTAVCFAYTVLNDPQTPEAYFNYTDNEGRSQHLQD